MDRRTFSKLLTGTITAAGISKPGLAEAAPHAVPAGAAEQANKRGIPRQAGIDTEWELVILDAAPEHITETGGNAAADIDGDGKTELVVCGNGGQPCPRFPRISRHLVCKQARLVAIHGVGDGSSNPESKRSSVDLPAPLVPDKAQMLGSTTRSMPRRTGREA